jgi:hypothetical protein
MIARQAAGPGGAGEVLHELQQAMPYGLLARDVADVTVDGEAAPPEQT